MYKTNNMDFIKQDILYFFGERSMMVDTSSATILNQQYSVSTQIISPELASFFMIVGIIVSIVVIGYTLSKLAIRLPTILSP
jgi:hypothetical protein